MTHQQLIEVVVRFTWAEVMHDPAYVRAALIQIVRTRTRGSA
ncbi:hypothetical protein [Nocardioides sp.]|nr:hypothetical protein [Nocardioides sp.]